MQLPNIVAYSMVLWDQDPTDPVAKALADLKARLGDEALQTGIVQPAANTVRKKVDPKSIDPVVRAICGKP